MGWSRWEPSAGSHATFVSFKVHKLYSQPLIVENSDTYGAQITMDELMMSVDRHLSLREDKTSMLIFGNGDGGGGPLPQMVKILAGFDRALLTYITD